MPFNPFGDIDDYPDADEDGPFDAFRKKFEAMPEFIRKGIAGAISGVIVAGIMRGTVQVAVDKENFVVRLPKQIVDRAIKEKVGSIP